MTNDYMAAIEQIIKGAERFRKICDNEENATYQEPDSESSFLRVPVGAFCLKLAYKVWDDLHRDARYPLGIGGALMGAGPGGPPPGYMQSAKQYAGKMTKSVMMTDQPAMEKELDKYELLYQAMSKLSSEEIEEFCTEFSKKTKKKAE